MIVVTIRLIAVRKCGPVRHIAIRIVAIREMPVGQEMGSVGPSGREPVERERRHHRQDERGPCKLRQERAPIVRYLGGCTIRAGIDPRRNSSFAEHCCHPVSKYPGQVVRPR